MSRTRNWSRALDEGLAMVNPMETAVAPVASEPVVKVMEAPNGNLYLDWLNGKNMAHFAGASLYYTAPVAPVASEEVEAMCERLNNAANEPAGAPRDARDQLMDEAATMLRTQAAQIDAQDKLAALHVATMQEQAAQIAELRAENAKFAEDSAGLLAQIAELQTKAQVQYGELIGGDDRRDAERWRFLEKNGFPADGTGRDFDMFCAGWQALEEKINAAIAQPQS